MIALIFFGILPIKIFYENGLMYSYGSSVNLLKASLAIFVIIWLIMLITNVKKIKQKQYFPIIAVILMLLANVILQTIDPTVLIATFTMTFACYIIFFTIENPDLKMVRQLQLAQKQMEKSNQIKEEFLSSMSHEIRTPLNAIVGCSQLIEYSDTLEEAKENAKDIVDSSNTLLNMYSNMLDIYSLEADNIEIVNKLYNPKEEFNKLLSMFEYRINEKNLKLNIQIDNIPNLIGDVNIIKKVLINVLDNAIKYTEKGSITFIAKFNDNRLNIFIEDTGKGIKKENLDKLFNNFERLDYKDSNVNGMGLGLSLSKNLLELISGSIKIESIYEKGTKVIVSVKQEAKNESINS